MIRNLAWLAGCCFAVSTIPVLAGTYYSVEFIPASPAADEDIVVHLAGTMGDICWPDAPSSIAQAGSTIVLTLGYDDACLPGHLGPSHDYAIGRYPAGSYVFEVESCLDLPLPFPPECQIGLEAPLQIRGSGSDPVAAPTLSMTGAFLAILGLCTIAMRSRGSKKKT